MKSFLTECKTTAASCNFEHKDRMMRDKIVFTVTRKLQELLLTVDGLTLEKAVKVCRAYEQSSISKLRSLETTQTPPVHGQK